MGPLVMVGAALAFAAFFFAGACFYLARFWRALDMPRAAAVMRTFGYVLFVAYGLAALYAWGVLP